MTARGDEPEAPAPPEIVVLAGVAIAVGLLLRFVARTPLWLDEALSVNIAALPPGEILDALEHDGHPPLYYLLLHGWMEVFGSSDAVVRALSGVISVVTLPLAWVAGRRRGGRQLAWVLVAVMAVAPFALRYATETRMYSLVMLLVFAGYLLLDDVLALGRGRWRYPALGLLSGLLLLTHYWSMWLLAGVGLVLVWIAWRRWSAPVGRRAALALGWMVGGSVVCFAWWVPTMLFQAAHTGTPWASPFRPSVTASVVLVDLSAATGALADSPALAVIGAMLFALGLFGRAVSSTRIDLELRTVPQVRYEAVVFGLVLGIGVLAGYATSSAFASRYAAAIFPLYALVVAAGITRFGSRLGVALALSTLLLGSGVAGLFSSFVAQRSQSRVLAEAVMETARPGDVVVSCPDQLGPSLNREIIAAGGEDLDAVTYPTLAPPAMVDWVDYAERAAAVDPGELAAQVVERAGPEHAIYVVWAGTYRTFEDQCEAFVGAIGAQRPNMQFAVSDEGDRYFEHAEPQLVPRGELSIDTMAGLRRDVVRVLPAFVAARVLVGLAWLVADAITADWSTRPNQLDEGLVAWDGTWYRDIASDGYSGVALEGIRFFPLFPLMGRLLAATGLIGTSMALVVVANLAAFGLALLVRRLVLGEGRSEAAADRAVAFVMLFPSAFVLVFAYSESIMLCAVAGALLCARREAWWWAALAGLVAALSRPLGVVLAPALLVEVVLWWRTGARAQQHGRGSARAGAVAAVLGPLAGVSAFLLWARGRGAGLLGPLTVQSELRGETVDPLSRLWQGLVDLAGPERFGDGLHIPFAIAFIVLFVAGLRRWPASFSVYSGLVLLASLGVENLNSLERYGLNALPIVLTLSELARTQRTERIGLAVCACGLLSLSALAFVGTYVP